MFHLFYLLLTGEKCFSFCSFFFSSNTSNTIIYNAFQPKSLNILNQTI